MESRGQRIAKMQQKYKEHEEAYTNMGIRCPGTKEIVSVSHEVPKTCRMCMEDDYDGYEIRIWSLVRPEVVATISLCQMCAEEFAMAFPFGEIKD